MEEEEKNDNLIFKNDQNKFKPLLINGRTYRVVSKLNPKYNPNSNDEQKTGFNNIKNAKEIEENDDVDSYSGDSDFLQEEDENKDNNNNIKEGEEEEVES